MHRGGRALGYALLPHAAHEVGCWGERGPTKAATSDGPFIIDP